jgi:hypothetical protein
LDKEGLKAAGEGAASVAANLLGIPSMDAAFSAGKSLFKLGQLYRMANTGKKTIVSDKDKEMNPFWDALTLDNGKDEVLDRRVEQEFLAYVEDRIDGRADTDPMPDIDNMLNRWLKRKYDGVYLGKHGRS